MNIAERPNLVGLVDLDGTLANYSKAVLEGLELLRGPDEPVVLPNFGEEPEHIKNRIRAIRSRPGWWFDLEPLPLGFKLLDMLRKYDFSLNILTKGPWSHSLSWTEKVDWCRKYVPDASITVTEDKSIVYGKVLIDDYIPYVESWLEYRPRGLAILPSQPWNNGFEHPNAIIATEDNLHEVEVKLVETIGKSISG